MNQLTQLLKPKSITVIGASNNPLRAGNVIIRNLLSESFNGPILPVNPKYKAIAGVLAYPDIDSLPLIPDLAIVCTRAERNVDLIEQLGKKGVKAAIILASGMNIRVSCNSESANSEPSEEAKMLAKAKQYGMRLIGPNSMGLILPWLNVNASFSPINANRGNIAFISQSSAVCTTILDWAKNKNIGFSTFLSLGDACDVDFAELLDVLCQDSKTTSILLYMDSIKDARRFMSAARAAARNRHILVLKNGRTPTGSHLAHFHTGGHIGLDAVYDAAIRRSGMLRVNNTHDLFAAVQTLAHSVPLRGERLAILTNGGGPAIMAVDELLDKGGTLAQLSQDTQNKLASVLPPFCSVSNPIDIAGDADFQRYQQVINILLNSDDFDALLIMHSPSALANSSQTASILIDQLHQHPRIKRFNILTYWAAADDRHLFTEAGFPTYRTPESAISSFMHLVEYRRNKKQLMETPISFGEITANPQHVRNTIKDFLSQGIHQLASHEVRPIIESYGLQTLPTWIASDATVAVNIAEKIGYPVAVKLRSPDIRHKSEVQGVVLDLRHATEVASAAKAILERVSIYDPSARIDGLLVQRMADRSGAQELRIVVQHDPVFGPVILIGEENARWDVHRDATVGIPPLNMELARYMVINALNSGKIKHRSSLKHIDINALCKLLVSISQLIIDCPEIISFDIHPLLVAGDKLTVLDASMEIYSFRGDKQKRLAIRPYPKQHEQVCQLKNGASLLLRPILPEDEPHHKAFINRVSKEDLYSRFFSDVGELNHEALARFTQIDYDREMAFVAVSQESKIVDLEILGVARVISGSDELDAEFAILVRSDFKGLGLGRILMEKLIDYSQRRGVKSLSAITMPNNQGMITLAKKLGFSVDVQLADGIVELKLHLN